jgi:hypothetical protein
MAPETLIEDLCSYLVVDPSRAWAVVEALGGRLERNEGTSRQGGNGRVVHGWWPNGQIIATYQNAVTFEALTNYCAYKDISFTVHHRPNMPNKQFKITVANNKGTNDLRMETLFGRTPWLTLAAALVKLVTVQSNKGEPT